MKNTKPHNPMQEILQGCSLHALLMLTSKALTRSGFGDVEILDRRSTKEKTRFGGYELSCRLTLGNLPAKVIVKVIQDEVRQRMLDELAGSILRSGADAGLIVTPFHLSTSVKRAQPSYRPLRIHIVEGEELADILTRAQVGTRKQGTPDFAFFSELEEVSGRIRSFMREEAQ